MKQNTKILIILILLVKFYPFVLAYGHKLKAEPNNLWCPLCAYSSFSSNFNLVVALLHQSTPINFLIVILEPGCIFWGRDTVYIYCTIHVYNIVSVYDTLFIYTVTAHVKW